MLTRHGDGPYAGGKRMAPRRIEVRTLYNPEKRTAVQIVPALIGVILSMTMVLFTSGAIVRERERGNLELLIATPLGWLELMVGKLLPYVGIGLIQTTIILIVGSALFNVPVVGQPAGPVRRGTAVHRGVAGARACSSRRWRRPSSRRSSSPSSPCCRRSCCPGFMFPFEGMPKVVQWIAQVLPLTHFNVIIRGVMLRGADLPELWPQVVKLVVFIAVMLLIAVARFKKRLD